MIKNRCIAYDTTRTSSDLPCVPSTGISTHNPVN